MGIGHVYSWCNRPSNATVGVGAKPQLGQAMVQPGLNETPLAIVDDHKNDAVLVGIQSKSLAGLNDLAVFTLDDLENEVLFEDEDWESQNSDSESNCKDSDDELHIELVDMYYG